uniref:Uncharacterized protein n=1 Tax=Magallana gigas TaxID=29159 RepID=K1Q0N2_MAGGI
MLNEVLRLYEQERHGLPGRRKRGGDLEAEWGSAAPSVATRLDVTTIMPKRSKAEKTKLLHNFALDAVDRCTAEINQARELYAEDANKI